MGVGSGTATGATSGAAVGVTTGAMEELDEEMEELDEEMEDSVHRPHVVSKLALHQFLVESPLEPWKSWMKRWRTVSTDLM